MPEPIYRAPMRSRSRDDLPPGAGADWGLARDAVAIDAAGERGAARLDRFAALRDGAFVWTRASDGTYHLGRVAGPCRADPDASVVGLTHVRATRWLDRPFGEHEVPAAVAATFARGGKNFQRTHGAAGEERTAALWAEYA